MLSCIVDNMLSPTYLIKCELQFVLLKSSPNLLFGSEITPSMSSYESICFITEHGSLQLPIKMCLSPSFSFAQAVTFHGSDSLTGAMDVDDVALVLDLASQNQLLVVFDDSSGIGADFLLRKLPSVASLGFEPISVDSTPNIPENGARQGLLDQPSME